MDLDDDTGFQLGPEDLPPPPDLPALDLTTYKERRPRRIRFTPVATMLLSLAAGTATGYLIFVRPVKPPPPVQQLSGTLSLPSPEPLETTATTPRTRSGDRSRSRQDRKQASVQLKVRKTKTISAPAPVAQAPAPASTSDGRREKKKRNRAGQDQGPQWPTATLFHLYRKRDRRHIYTIDAALAQYARQSDGYKDRLQPGLVYLEDGKGRVRVPVDVFVDYYGNSVPAFVFAEDQGAKTFPLYYLTGNQGREMVTSWEDIRASWIDKGWVDQGVVGFIYRI
jgi:hypothetical protein